jgi:RNA-directed DNA polymerase
MSNTDSVVEPNTVEWNKLNWKKIQKSVFKLQKRIYKASLSGNTKEVRKLQKTMTRSWNAKLLATRQVTQDNTGKRTAGIDGVKSVPPNERSHLAQKLNLKQRPLPARRIYIPKPGKDEKRPLSIPAMRDRALQALVKLALEPEWEAKFEPNSYGFRSGRSAHDAIATIYNSIKQKDKFVLDADISKCFDRIDHNYLINKLSTYPTLARLIKSWLKAGWIFRGFKEESIEGTPQGGVISPLLANVALHGMENRLKQYAESLKIKGLSKSSKRDSLTFVRYADDFVVLHENQDVISRSKEVISDWLKEVGLELSEAKTRISHTLNPFGNNKPGFEFLGFNIRQYPMGTHQTGKNPHGIKLGFKTFIKPSTKKVIEHYKKIADIISQHNAAPQKVLIMKLNPIIRGWANYYSAVVSKEIYGKIDQLIWLRLKRWCQRRHRNKNATWSLRKYFKTVGNRNWVFSEGDIALASHMETIIIRHVKVKGTASPFNGDDTYWASRLGKHPELPTRIVILLKKQKGKCNQCGLTFRDDEQLEVDHIIPTIKGGKNFYSNLQLLHRHCHDVKTANDGSGCTYEKGRTIEEPCEVKVSRTVLKTSGSREEIA